MAAKTLIKMNQKKTFNTVVGSINYWNDITIYTRAEIFLINGKVIKIHLN